jgi:hypothetical protein
MLPAVGTEEFKKLSFQSQLEVISLQLFDPEEYYTQVGEPLEEPSDFELDYPPLPKIELPDLPAVFLKRYWAGYSCSFREQWYRTMLGSRGFTPLDQFDIDVGKMINVRTFNFTMLSTSSALYHIFKWIVEHLFGGSHHPLALLYACKVLVYLDLTISDEDKLRDICKNSAGDVYGLATDRYFDLYDFYDLNGYHPIIEECDDLLFMEGRDFIIHAQARLWEGRWYFPLVPADLYRAEKFHIFNWGFLNSREN